ncbi:P-loop containing nucleoside triphosphate hydrolase protein [Jackrogersella minutella]|nr:P-loop containing nucleoside triphosphate hydrolase protein [Jackrogersella minutella]
MLGGNTKVPRKEQVDAVHDLVFNEIDLVFIAKTSFGKSLIIQAFSLITDRITIQIAPLVKLGEEQRDSVLKVPWSTPLLICADTRAHDKEMFKRLAAGDHSHIILSPEQISVPGFQKALTSQIFSQRCGLLAIDEAHLLSDWNEFRPEFAQIRNLRYLLGRHVHWFACTATASKSTENQILKYGGFLVGSSVATASYKLSIRRFSADRPEIDIGVFPIPRGFSTDWAQLNFLFPNDLLPNSRGLALIPKTIIYIDSKAKTLAIREHLVKTLLDKGFLEDDVRGTIKFYTSSVPAGDQACIYNEFKNQGSRTRIVISTVALGLGMDIPDISRIVQWGFPTSLSIEDLWQRFSRAVRGFSRLGMQEHGQAILFAPYWAFDRLGVDRTTGRRQGRSSSTRSPVDTVVQGSPSENQGAVDADSSATEEGDADVEAGAPLSDQDDSCNGRSGEALVVPNTRPTKLRTWTSEELSNRSKLGGQWHELINGSCVRRVILSVLCEEEASKFEGDDVNLPGGNLCCTSCTPGLIEVSDAPLASRLSVWREPRKGKFKGYAWEMLQYWRRQKTRQLFSKERYQMGSEGLEWMFMPTALVRALLSTFPGDKRKAREGYPYKSVGDLAAAVDGLAEWQYWSQLQSQLLKALCLIHQKALDKVTSDELDTLTRAKTVPR